MLFLQTSTKAKQKMATLYLALKTIHILSAILGLGPGFIMIYMVRLASNMTELRQAYKIRNRTHIFVMVGGTLLLLTGLGMGFINPIFFHTQWYMTGLVLFLIALGFGPVILSPCSKPIKKILREYQGEEIPEDYYRFSRKLFFWERVENVIFGAVILLMILKPSRLFLVDLLPYFH